MIDHFTVVCSVSRPLSRGEARRHCFGSCAYRVILTLKRPWTSSYKKNRKVKKSCVSFCLASIWTVLWRTLFESWTFLVNRELKLPSKVQLSPFRHKGPMSKMVTLTRPYNPFNKVWNWLFLPSHNSGWHGLWCVWRLIRVEWKDFDLLAHSTAEKFFLWWTC